MPKSPKQIDRKVDVTRDEIAEILAETNGFLLAVAGILGEALGGQAQQNIQSMQRQFVTTLQQIEEKYHPTDERELGKEGKKDE